MSNLLAMIARMGIEVMVWLIIIRVFLSYIPHNPYNTILRFIYETTEPILGAVSKFMPTILRAPLDFTPLVAIIGLQMLIMPLVLAVIRVLPF